MFAWGRNVEGQCGQEQSIQHVSLPTQVTLEVSKYRCVSIAAHGSYSCATVDAAARAGLFEWGVITVEAEQVQDEGNKLKFRVSRFTSKPMGDGQQRMLEESQRSHLRNGNIEGRQGDNNICEVERKVVTCPLLTWVPSVKILQVAPGVAHVVVLAKCGRLLSKGYNDKGQLGQNSRISSPIFRPVAFQDGAHNVKEVAAGNAHTVVLRRDGSIWVFGSNDFGQVSLKDTGRDYLLPMKLEEQGATRYIHVGAGDYNSFAIHESGNVIHWGHVVSMQGTASAVGDGKSFTIWPIDYAGAGVLKGVAIRQVYFSGLFNLILDNTGFLHNYRQIDVSVASWERSAEPEDCLVVSLKHHYVELFSCSSNRVVTLVRRPGSLHARRYQRLLGLSDKTVITCKPSFRDKSPKTISVLSFIVYARCPSLRNYASTSDDSGLTVLRLPQYVDFAVMLAFVDFLYCDHIDRCPAHKEFDLERLGALLDLPYLVYLATVTRKKRLGMIAAVLSLSLQTSTFTQDMLSLLDTGEGASIALRYSGEAANQEKSGTVSCKRYYTLLKLP